MKRMLSSHRIQVEFLPPDLSSFRPKLRFLILRLLSFLRDFHSKWSFPFLIEAYRFRRPTRSQDVPSLRWRGSPHLTCHSSAASLEDIFRVYPQRSSFVRRCTPVPHSCRENRTENAARLARASTWPSRAFHRRVPRGKRGQSKTPCSIQLEWSRHSHIQRQLNQFWYHLICDINITEVIIITTRKGGGAMGPLGILTFCLAFCFTQWHESHTITGIVFSYRYKHSTIVQVSWALTEHSYISRGEVSERPGRESELRGKISKMASCSFPILPPDEAIRYCKQLFDFTTSEDELRKPTVSQYLELREQ